MRMLRHLFSFSGKILSTTYNMNYSVLSRFQLICLDATIHETLPSKTGEKRLFWYMWTWSQCLGVNAPALDWFSLPFNRI